MTAVLYAVHVIAGLIVVAEGLNKLERTDPFEPGLCARARAVVWLKMAGWMLLVIGSGGAVVAPMLPHEPPPCWQDVLVQAGFALLIVRSRLGEGVKVEPAHVKA